MLRTGEIDPIADAKPSSESLKTGVFVSITHDNEAPGTARRGSESERSKKNVESLLHGETADSENNRFGSVIGKELDT